MAAGMMSLKILGQRGEETPHIANFNRPFDESFFWDLVCRREEGTAAKSSFYMPPHSRNTAQLR